MSRLDKVFVPPTLVQKYGLESEGLALEGVDSSALGGGNLRSATEIGLISSQESSGLTTEITRSAGQIDVVNTAISVNEQSIATISLERTVDNYGGLTVDLNISGLSAAGYPDQTVQVVWADGESGVKTYDVSLPTDISAQVQGSFTISNPVSDDPAALAPTLGVSSGTVTVNPVVSGAVTVTGASEITASIGVANSWQFAVTDAGNAVSNSVYWKGAQLPAGFSISDPGGPGSRTVTLSYDGTSLSEQTVTGDLVATDGDLFGAALPTWADEDNAYTARSEVTSKAVSPFSYLDEGNYSQSQLDSYINYEPADSEALHNDTEGDFLWTAYHMRQRLAGIVTNTSFASKVTATASYFINTYPTDQFTSAANTNEVNNNQDHLYGWGLCDVYAGDGTAGAIAAIDSIASQSAAWWSAETPGTTLLTSSNDGRRWARQLRFAVRAAEVSPIQTNVDWASKVINLVLDGPDFHSDVNCYVFSPSNVYTNTGRDYSAGDRLVNSFQMGIWADALWNAWRYLSAQGDRRASVVRERLLGLADFNYNYAQRPAGDGLAELFYGVNINDLNTPIVAATGNQTGSPSGVYSVCPINSLVFGYKLNGNSLYLDKAWDLWLSFHAAKTGDPKGELDHYVDTALASGDGYRVLAHNKGELQYMYSLFENSGVPTQV